MSIGITYASVTEADLRRAQTDESLAEVLIGLRGSRPRAVDIVWFSSEWDGLWWLLSPERRVGREFEQGASDPQGRAVIGGELLNSSYDFGYGPPRFLNPGEVEIASAAISTMSLDQLRRHYDPAEMCRKKVYPQTWVRDGDDGLCRLLECVAALQRFYCRAVAERFAVLVALG